jgi:hypothetical protein
MKWPPVARADAHVVIAAGAGAASVTGQVRGLRVNRRGRLLHSLGWPQRLARTHLCALPWLDAEYSSLFRIERTCHTGRDWRQWPIGFDLRWRSRSNEVGNAPCHGNGGQNRSNSKTQSDHFFAFSPDQPACPHYSGWRNSSPRIVTPKLGRAAIAALLFYRLLKCSPAKNARHRLFDNVAIATAI